MQGGLPEPEAKIEALRQTRELMHLRQIIGLVALNSAPRYESPEMIELWKNVTTKLPDTVDYYPDGIRQGIDGDPHHSLRSTIRTVDLPLHQLAFKTFQVRDEAKLPPLYPELGSEQILTPEEFQMLAGIHSALTSA